MRSECNGANPERNYTKVNIRIVWMGAMLSERVRMKCERIMYHCCNIYYVSSGDKSFQRRFSGEKANRLLTNNNRKKKSCWLGLWKGDAGCTRRTEKARSRHAHASTDKLKGISHQLTFNYLSRIFNLHESVWCATVRVCAWRERLLRKYFIICEHKIDGKMKLPMPLSADAMWY